MLEICIQTSYDQNIQLNLKSYLPVVYENKKDIGLYVLFRTFHDNFQEGYELSIFVHFCKTCSRLLRFFLSSVWFES